MRLLLDSHVVLWWLAADPAIGPEATRQIREADTVHVSAVTPWELGMKRALGKISYPPDLLHHLDQAGFIELPITSRHAETAAALPAHHRDPFDRMLVAQARHEHLVLVTADRALTPYDIDRLDART